MKRTTETIVRAALAADGGIAADQIVRILRLLKGKPPEEAPQPVRFAVNQARVSEMLRFHGRKLERLGLLKSVDLAGLKRYPMSSILGLGPSGGGPRDPGVDQSANGAEIFGCLTHEANLLNQSPQR